MPETFINGALIAKKHEGLTISTTVLPLTAATYQIVRTTNPPYDKTEMPIEALVTAETQPVRYTVDGTTPSSTVGHLLNVNDTIHITGVQNIVQARFIRQGASDGTIKVTYFYL